MVVHLIVDLRVNVSHCSLIALAPCPGGWLEGRECDALMPERIKQQCDGSILLPVTHLTRHLKGRQAVGGEGDAIRRIHSDYYVARPPVAGDAI